MSKEVDAGGRFDIFLDSACLLIQPLMIPLHNIDKKILKSIEFKIINTTIPNIHVRNRRNVICIP